MIVEDITTFLQGDAAGIGALIGVGAAGRVYWQNLPQNAVLPAIVCQQIAGHTNSTLENATGFVYETFQIMTYALDFKTCKQLSEKVRARLEGYAGTFGASQLQGAFCEAVRDLFDSVALHYRNDLVFKLMHVEPF